MLVSVAVGNVFFVQKNQSEKKFKPENLINIPGF